MAGHVDTPVKKKRRLYSDEALRQAYEAVMIDDMSMYAAARAFGVPERTLADRCKGLVPLDCKPGGNSHLTHEEEKKLCNQLKQLFFEGNDMTYTYMRHVATDFIRDLNKKTLKPGVVVTKKWLSAFLKRWPDFKKMLNSKAVVKIEVKNGEENIGSGNDQAEAKGIQTDEGLEQLSEMEEHSDQPEDSQPELGETHSADTTSKLAREKLAEEDIQDISASVNAAASFAPTKNAPVVYKANIVRTRTETVNSKPTSDPVLVTSGKENKQVTLTASDNVNTGVVNKPAESIQHTALQSGNKQTISIINTPAVALEVLPSLVTTVADLPDSSVYVLPSTSVSTQSTPTTQNVTLVLNQEKRKKRNYPHEAMVQAYEAVKNLGMKVHRAADVYGVPEKTLADKIAGKVAIDAKSGPRFYLTHDEEEKLCNYFTERLVKGECLTHAMMREIASQFMQDLDIKRKPDSKLTTQWLTQYLKRWPDLDELVRENLAMKEVSKKMDSMYAYYDELSSLLTDFALDECPQQIYMIEETEIPQVLSNFKPVTVIAGANALGQALPPYIVYKSLTANSDMIEGIPENAKIALEQAEVTKFDRLHAYLEAHFCQMLFERDTTKPILVFYDSHKNNLPIKITDWANANNVFFQGYPPPDVKHFTHVDCKLMGTFEWKFREACLRFSQMSRQKVTRKQITALTCSAYDLSLTPDAVQLVFSSAGIYPYSCPLQPRDGDVSVSSQ